MVPNKEIYDSLVKSDEFDEQSRKLFIDTVSYVEKLIEQNKQFDTDLYKIYITQIKGYELPTVQQFMRIVILLNLCGFNLTLS